MMIDLDFVSTIQTCLTFKESQIFLIFNHPYCRYRYWESFLFSLGLVIETQTFSVLVSVSSWRLSLHLGLADPCLLFIRQKIFWNLDSLHLEIKTLLKFIMNKHIDWTQKNKNVDINFYHYFWTLGVKYLVWNLYSA